MRSMLARRWGAIVVVLCVVALPFGVRAAVPFPSPSQLVDVSGTGEQTTAITAAAGTVVVKSSPGRIGRILVTVAGTASTTCYDSSSAASGTVIAITPATTTIGSVYDFAMPAAAGIVCSNPASSAGITVSFQ